MNRLIVLLAAASVACIPIRPTVREAKSGLILDASTRGPVGGAIVRVETYRGGRPGGLFRLLDSLEVRTDSDGRWSVPTEHEWTIGILAADGFPAYSSVYCVFADRYVDEVRNPNGAWLEPFPPSTADLRKDRDMDAVLLLERSQPQSHSDANGRPALARSCLASEAAQLGIAADRASPGR